jgi:hypothetical protein
MDMTGLRMIPSGTLLCRLLLGIDGAVARRRCHERALDRPPRAARVFGAGHVHGPPDRASRWYRPRCGRRVAIFNGDVLTARAAAGRAQGLP